MSKLDWNRAGQHIPDLTKQARDRQDTELVNTPTARKEAKKKAKAKNAAARQAAVTRKLNREKQAQAVQAATIHSRQSAVAEEAFWAKLKVRMALANERRRKRMVDRSCQRNSSEST